MRYTYSSLYHLLGFTVGSTDEEIFSDTVRGIRAVLTSDPTSLCAHLDKALVIPGMLFGAKLGEGPEMDERLAQEVDRLRDKRAKTFEGGAYLYFEATGDVQAFTPEVLRDCGSLIVAIDQVPKETLRNLWEPLVSKILAAVAVAMPAVTRPEKVASATVFFSADGTPTYGFNLQMGTPEVIVSRRPSPEDLTGIRTLTTKMAADISLERIVRLLNESMEPGQDRLRRFLAAFMGMEVFVNKNFGDYQHRFWNDLSADVTAPIRDRYLARIHDVMKDKYKLLEKFVLISAELDPAAADGDIATFHRGKDLRDAFSHGEAIDEQSFPVTELQALLRKFLRLHVERT